MARQQPLTKTMAEVRAEAAERVRLREEERAAWLQTPEGQESEAEHIRLAKQRQAYEAARLSDPFGHGKHCGELGLVREPPEDFTDEAKELWIAGWNAGRAEG